MEREHARDIAQRHLSGLAATMGISLAITDSRAVSCGWLFFFGSVAHIRTGSVSDMLAGNAPLLVDDRDGSIHGLSTALPVEDYVAMHERSRAS